MNDQRLRHMKRFELANRYAWLEVQAQAYHDMGMRRGNAVRMRRATLLWEMAANRFNELPIANVTSFQSSRD